MRVRIDYGTRGLEVELPDGITDVIAPRDDRGVADEREALRNALSRPDLGSELRDAALRAEGPPIGHGGLPAHTSGSAPLAAFVKPSDRVGIVFNDITRPTPNRVILPAILEELKRASVPEDRVTLFNATGTHRANSDAELLEILGEEIAGKLRIGGTRGSRTGGPTAGGQSGPSVISTEGLACCANRAASGAGSRRLRLRQNDARDAAAHVKIGTTKRGTEVFVDREFMECDLHILTGFIEPHFFAGFSGGPKAIVPGLASIRTVIRNHGPVNLDHPNARWGITRGNPVWEDIFEAASMVPRLFIVNVTLNRQKKITRVFAGDMEEAHAEGCAYAREAAMAHVGREYDIVVTSNSGYPLDLNLYQSVKGMSAAAQIVKPGGSIVIAAECRDGVPEHGSFGRLLREARDAGDLLARMRGPCSGSDDVWEALILGLILQKAEVWMYSEGLSEEQVRMAKLKPCARIEDTVGSLLRRCGKGARICVLPEGPQTIPYLSRPSGV